MRLSLSCMVLAILSAGCTSSKSFSSGSQVAGAKRVSLAKDVDAWKLTATDPNAVIPALLWNGKLGVRFSRSGAGLGPDSRPLGFYMIDEYESGGEEKLLPLPNPVLVSWSIGNNLYGGDQNKEHDFVQSGGTILNPFKDADGYAQSIDLKTGILTTRWNQRSPEGGLVKYLCESAVHPTERSLGQRWTISVEKPTTFSVKSLDYSGPNDPQTPVGGDSSQRMILTASKSRVVLVHTKWDGTDATAVFGGGFRIWEGKVDPKTPIVFERVLSFGPHSSKALPEFTEKNLAQLKLATPKLFSFDDLVTASKKAWADRWKTDIVLDGPVEDQRAIRSFLFYLRSAIDPNLARSISPFGLSDAKYNGHIFWDSDIWVFPALALLDPKEAASISDYRIMKEPMAEGNFRGWFASQKKSPQTRSGVGVKYPWESSVTGRETVLGPSQLEQHITGSVLWELTQACALGLAPSPEVDRFAALAANFYYSLGIRNSKGRLEIKHVMSPDENHTGDNDLYTNLLANWLATGRRWGQPADALPFVLPRDSQSFLTYEGDPVRGYKQAAAILSIYPLQFPEAEQAGLKMMERFESKVIPNGPAMSDSVNSVIWSRLGDSSKAYADWQKSWQPFTDNPFLLFSEKRNSEQTYFTTGAAGSLQAVLYGFLGFRIDLTPGPGSAWQVPLMDHRVLSMKPNLPSNWKSVTLKNFTVLGNHYTATVAHSGVHVTQGE